MSENNNTNLVHCIYSSAEVTSFDQASILELLETARANNARLNITGMLLYDRGSFFQILEGEPKSVDYLLQSIQKDNRHERVVRIIYEQIEHRDFPDWTMGYSGVSKKDLSNIEGLNDFFLGGNRFIDLDEGRAKILLRAFKDGKWHTSLA